MNTPHTNEMKLEMKMKAMVSAVDAVTNFNLVQIKVIKNKHLDQIPTVSAERALEIMFDDAEGMIPAKVVGICRESLLLIRYGTPENHRYFTVGMIEMATTECTKARDAGDKDAYIGKYLDLYRQRFAHIFTE